MMDATSLSFSAFSLAIQLFHVVTDGYSSLRQTRHPETPLSDEVGLQVQQCRFMSWAKATGLSDERLSQFEDSFMQRTLLNALCDMLELLEEAFSPNNKYGILFQPTNPPAMELLRTSRQMYTSRLPSMTASEAASLGTPTSTKHPQRAQALLVSARLLFSAFEHSRWIISDGNLFRSLIQQLREKNDNLEWLVPRPVQISAAELCETVMLQSENAGHLKRIAQATSSSLPSLAQSADFKSSYIDTNMNRGAVNQANYIHRTQLVLDSTSKGSRTLATYEVQGSASVRVLVEWKRKGILKDTTSIEESERITIDRIKRLTIILARPTDASFRSLFCLGYSTSIDGSTGLVFKLPSDAAKAHAPVSLLGFLHNSESKNSKKPPLEERLRLCHALALSIYRLHRTGVIHKHITPTNIIFFPHKSTAVTSILEPFLTGFDFAREEITVSQSEVPEDQIDGEELYRHPSWKFGKPSTKAVDIYALGILLIEIGSWQSIKKAKQRAAKGGVTDFRAFLLTEFIDSDFLAYRMGTDFQNAVKHCLEVTLASEGEEDSSMLGSFYGNVVQGLASFLLTH